MPVGITVLENNVARSARLENIVPDDLVSMRQIRNARQSQG
jgi:hypothetical protein